MSDVGVHIKTGPGGMLNKAIWGRSLPRNFLLEFDYDSDHDAWQVLLDVQSATSFITMGPQDGSIDIGEFSDGQHTNLFTQSMRTPFSGRVKVAKREELLGDSVGGTVWHTYSMWINDIPVLHYTRPGTYSYHVRQIGFGYWGQGEVKFSNIRIPELSEFLDWSSIDPGEAAMGALSRAIEGRYVKYHIRPNGELRAWIPKPTPSVHTYALEDFYSDGFTIDRRAVKTHVRQHGAYVYADYIDHELVKVYGHQYAEINNPYLLTPDECLEQARLTVRRMQEQALSQNFETPYHPLIEIEDHVTTPDGERIVGSRNVAYEPGGATDSIQSRAYIYGS